MMKRKLMIALTAFVLCASARLWAGAGNCLEFDGAGDYAQAAGLSSALTNITVEAWVKHRSLGDAVQRYVTVGDEVAVLRHNVGGGQADGLHFYIKTDGSLKHLATGSALPVGAWHHVADSVQ